MNVAKVANRLLHWGERPPTPARPLEDPSFVGEGSPAAPCCLLGGRVNIAICANLLYQDSERWQKAPWICLHTVPWMNLRYIPHSGLRTRVRHRHTRQDVLTSADPAGAYPLKRKDDRGGSAVRASVTGLGARGPREHNAKAAPRVTIDHAEHQAYFGPFHSCHTSSGCAIAEVFSLYKKKKSYRRREERQGAIASGSWARRHKLPKTREAHLDGHPHCDQVPSRSCLLGDELAPAPMLAKRGVPEISACKDRGRCPCVAPTATVQRLGKGASQKTQGTRLRASIYCRFGVRAAGTWMALVLRWPFRTDRSLSP